MLNKAQIKGETQGIAVKSEELQLEDISLNTPQQVAVKPEPSTPLPNVVIKCEPNPQPRAPGEGYDTANGCMWNYFGLDMATTQKRHCLFFYSMHEIRKQLQF